jgi:hypothetical protein
MEKKEIIKMINEELGGYNYINLDELTAQDDNVQLLSSKEFQVQFVSDVVNNFKDTIKLSDVNTMHTTEEDLFNHGEETGKALNIEYDVNIIYKYMGRDIKLMLAFEGNNVGYGMGGYYDAGNYGEYRAPEGDTYYTYINWNDIGLSMYDDEGNEINVGWINKNPKLHDAFVKKFIEDSLMFDIKKRG